MGHVFNPPIVIHIKLGGVKNCPLVWVNMSDVNHNGALSPVWILHILSPMKNL